MVSGLDVRPFDIQPALAAFGAGREIGRQRREDEFVAGQRNALAEAGGAAAKGQIGEAQNTLLRAGNLQGADYFRQQQAGQSEAEQARQAEIRQGLAAIAANQAIPDEQWPQAVEQYLRVNGTPEDLADLPIFADPQIRPLLAGPGESYTLGPDDTRFQGTTPIATGTPAAGEPPPTKRLVGPDGELHEYGWNPETQRYDVDYGIYRGTPLVQNTNNVGPTGVDYGDPPADHAWARNPDTNEVLLDERGAPIPLPIGPAQTEAAQRGLAMELAEAQALRLQEVMDDEIGRAIEIIERNPNWTTALGGTIIRNWPGSEALTLDQILATIKGQLGVDQLTAMRAASPSGASGFGQLTERELAVIQGLMGSFDQRLSPDQLLYNLNRLRESLARYNYYVSAARAAAQGQELPPIPPGLGITIDAAPQTSSPLAAPAETPAGGQTQPQTTTPRPPPEVGAEMDGYRFLGGDPADPANWQAVQ